MDVVGVVVVVVVEVDGRDNMELGMEDIEENIEDIVDFSHKFLANDGKYLIACDSAWTTQILISFFSSCILNISTCLPRLLRISVLMLSKNFQV